MMSDTITLLRAYVCENVPNLIIISMNQIDKRENRYYFMNRCLKRTRRKLKKKVTSYHVPVIIIQKEKESLNTLTIHM